MRPDYRTDLMTAAATAWGREDLLDPWTIADTLGQFPPTEEQAAVIAAGPGPVLVVAGAGAGKTETMAARVVWLIANGLASPHEVLGLTFTRKATQELAERITRRVRQLADSDLFASRPATDPLRLAAEYGTTTALTYDSFVQQVLDEYGLLVPVEPGRTVITHAQQFLLARDVVRAAPPELVKSSTPAETTIIDAVLALRAEMIDNHVTRADLEEEQRRVLATTTALSSAPKAIVECEEAAANRLALADCVAALNAAMAEQGLTDFAQLAADAATLVADHPMIGATHRQRYRVVLLDEYQDTSSTQREFLSTLFAHQPGDPGERPGCVMAVGDPMQSIYGFRGAVAANLERFPTDFPDPSGHPAPVLQLLTSWRNPARILDLANRVVDDIVAQSPSGQRLVDPLVAAPHSGAGQVRVAVTTTPEEETAVLLTQLAQLRQEFRAQQGREPTTAVLVRTNAAAEQLLQSFTAAGVSAQVLSGAGLVDEPEVRAVLTLLQVAVTPEEDTAVIELLSSPRWRLGRGDLQALHDRVRALGGSPRQELPQPDSVAALEELTRRAAESLTAPPTAVSLGEALADVGPRRGVDQDPETGAEILRWEYTEAGYARLTELSAQLRSLRQRLAQPLTEVIAHAEWLSGVRMETLVRDDPAAGGIAAAQLDAFQAVAADFARLLPHASVVDFLDYVQLARTKERGLEAAPPVPDPTAVQILTMHKAKGLEWDIVALPRLSAETARVTFTPARMEAIPARLRRDSTVYHPSGGCPAFDFDTELDTVKKLKDALGDHRKELTEFAALEAARVFYVALTRAKWALVLSAAHWKGTNVKPKALHPQLEELKDVLRPEEILRWDPAPQDGASNPHTTAQADTSAPVWPDPSPIDPVLREAAELVAAVDLTAAAADTHPLAVETTALIEEQQRRRAELHVARPQRLSTSELVGLAQDEEGFLRRLVRPVPMAPQPFARRGTDFHLWVEHHYGATQLELGFDGAELTREDAEVLPQPQAQVDLHSLQEAFLASPWAERTPTHLEWAFEFTYGDTVVPGRIDAIFADPDGGYTIIDWKTGQIPQGQAWTAAATQLTVYRAAWRAHLRRERGAAAEQVLIRAGFHYILPRQTRYLTDEHDGEQS